MRLKHLNRGFMHGVAKWSFERLGRVRFKGMEDCEYEGHGLRTALHMGTIEPMRWWSGVYALYLSILIAILHTYQSESPIVHDLLYVSNYL